MDRVEDLGTAYGDHQRVGREVQWRAWAAMTPAQRLRLMGRLTAMGIACRERCLRDLHPQADAARLTELRVAATLASSPSSVA